MELKEYIVVPVVLTKDKTIIPLLDERVVCQKNEDCYCEVGTKNGRWNGERIVEAVFDINTKTFSLGIEINYYPEAKDYKEGDDVLYEIKYDEWGLSKIQQIMFEEYDLNIQKGRNLDPWIRKIVEEKENIEKNMIYCIKEWKPFYLLENGKVIEWRHQLKKFVQ